MTRVVVEVMPKPEILDPQGQAIQKALTRLGFEVEVDAATAEDAMQAARQMAERLLANTVIEDFAVRVEG
jgi:phosphoribosylformylglycinamidine synthase PurS subunit